jgi:hypothetical protein
MSFSLSRDIVLESIVSIERARESESESERERERVE